MNKPLVSAVVLDLDNTLWDWFNIWHTTFSALLDEVERISGLTADDLKSEIRAVHQRHGTSEYAFLLQELPSLQRLHPDGDLGVIYAPAVEAFRRVRREVLQLYPKVFETLWTLRDHGCVLIAYTESRAYYSNYRLRKMCLDGVLDYLYSPPDHDLPEGLSREQLRLYPAGRYRMRRTEHRHTPEGQLKPSPELLSQILIDVGAEPGETIYVGDSLMKDVAMAQDAGVLDVHAAYGNRHLDSKAYDLLRDVTHWTAADVEHEKTIQARSSVSPSYVLEAGFPEILTLFEFESFRGRQVEALPEEAQVKPEVVVDVWKKVVEVQMHFNDIGMRIRNIAITVLTAIIGIVALALRQGSGTMAQLLLATGTVAWLGFYLMDRHWYHRLLKGAVSHGIEIERRNRATLPDIALSDAIGKASPVKLSRWGPTLHSDGKMSFFYGLVLFLLIALLVCAPSLAVSVAQGG